FRRNRRMLRGLRPRMSAACNHVRFPARACRMTSRVFLARSTAPRGVPLAHPSGAMAATGASWIGHFMYQQRSNHVSPTTEKGSLDLLPEPGQYLPPENL